MKTINPKAEVRNPKEGRNPKPEVRRATVLLLNKGVSASAWERRRSQVSDFGFSSP